MQSESPSLEGDSLLEELTGVTGLTTAQIRTALHYYAAYPEEIDQRIAANRATAEREEKLWLAEQDLLRPSRA